MMGMLVTGTNKDILKILGGKDGKILWNRRFSR